MRKQWNPAVLFAMIGLMLLIFDSRLAVESARSGVDLCIRTVIPALFPFIVLSMVLTDSMSTDGNILRFLAGILEIPTAAVPVLIPAFLGGYPVGAKCIHDLYCKGCIGKRQALRLLAFCSNAGPSFLFGMVSGFFPDPWMVWVLWLIHILSAFLAGMFFPSPAEEKTVGRREADRTEGADLLLSAIKAMAMICGWVILFRTLTAFLNRWCLFRLPQWLQVFLTGLLELTNGCCELGQISDVKLRFLLCSCMLSFGGICVLMQTASVTKGLSLRNYILGKGIQTLFSLLLSCGVIWEYGWLLPGILPAVLWFVRKIQKRSGNPGTVPV